MSSAVRRRASVSPTAQPRPGAVVSRVRDLRSEPATVQFARPRAVVKRWIRPLMGLFPTSPRSRVTSSRGVRPVSVWSAAEAWIRHPLRVRPPPGRNRCSFCTEAAEVHTVTLPPAIEAKGLFKVFGRNPKDAVRRLRTGATRADVADGTTAAVIDATFTVEPGEIFVVMGLSGSGKSTLLRMLNGLLEPTAATALRRRDLTGIADASCARCAARKISMVFQHFALFPHRSVLENAAYGLEVQGVAAAERASAPSTSPVRSGSRLGRLLPDELSGGMQQRVGLARALATDADLLLMDEAFSALDPLIRRDMQDQLMELQHELKKTIVFITHDLNEAMRLGDRIAVMRDGRIVQIGTAEDILTARPTTTSPIRPGRRPLPRADRRRRHGRAARPPPRRRAAGVRALRAMRDRRIPTMFGRRETEPARRRWPRARWWVVRAGGTSRARAPPTSSITPPTPLSSSSSPRRRPASPRRDAGAPARRRPAGHPARWLGERRRRTRGRRPSSGRCPQPCRSTRSRPTLAAVAREPRPAARCRIVPRPSKEPLGEHFRTAARRLAPRPSSTCSPTFGGFFDVVADVFPGVFDRSTSCSSTPPFWVVILALAALAWLRRRAGSSRVGTAVGLLVVVGVGPVGPHHGDPRPSCSSRPPSRSRIAVPARHPGPRASDLASSGRPPGPGLHADDAGFVYLIPAVFLFGVGVVPGMVATILFAIPPGVRLTELGIRGVDREVVEAGQAFGAWPGQILRQVQLPLALPSDHGRRQPGDHAGAVDGRHRRPGRRRRARRRRGAAR